MAASISFRISDVEQKKIQEELKALGLQNRSDYLRAKLLSPSKLNTIYNKGICRELLLSNSKLKTELNKIGVNFNQLVHIANTNKEVKLTKKERELIQDLGKKLEEATSTINYFIDNITENM